MRQRRGSERSLRRPEQAQSAEAPRYTVAGTNSRTGTQAQGSSESAMAFHFKRAFISVPINDCCKKVSDCSSSKDECRGAMQKCLDVRIDL